MILYIGGRAQGKWKLVCSRFGEGCRVADGVMPDTPVKEGEVVILRHAERIIPTDRITDPEQTGVMAAELAERIASLEESGGTVVVVSQEMGCGVVPADERDILKREAVGRFQTEIAARSGEVIRVVCGIGVRLGR